MVLNLLSNAIDASPQGGTVTLRTRAEEEGVAIEVLDNGDGIDPAIRDKIFDPFFTTKPIGKGTGLGLSIAYGIVQLHGGRISIESEPGKGTRFTVHLPLAPPSPAPGTSSNAHSLETQRKLIMTRRPRSGGRQATWPLHQNAKSCPGWLFLFVTQYVILELVGLTTE